MHKRIEKQLVGASGVFYVATELSRRGWIVNRRRKTSIRQFPNPEGKMLPEFKDFNINDYGDGWDLLQ